MEHNFTVPEMVSNYLDGLPSIDTTYANRATTSGAQVHLTPLRDGVATAVVHLRSDPITSVAALKSEVCATSASMTGGVASVITIASNGCTLVRNTQYDVYVYIQDGNDESDGTVSAPMELMLLSNEFSVDPTIRAPILPDTVSFVFTASRNGKMWAMIVDRASAASVKLSTMSAMRSLSSAKGGSLCSFGSAGVVANEVTTIVLFDCDGSSGLHIGSPYTLFVYVEDLSGALGTLKSLSFVVPEIVSNYFDGTPSVVAGTLTTSGVSLTMRSLFDGVAWLVVQRSSVGLESIVALKQSACKTSVSVSAGNSIILAVSSCALQLSASYNIYAYVEDSRGLNDGSLSAPMNVIVMSNNFMVSPTIRAPVNPESLTVQFSAQSSGFVWLMIVNRNDAYLAYNSSALKSEHPLGATLRRGGKMCRREKLAVVAGVAVRETLYNCNEGSNFLSVGAKYTLMAYIEDTSGAEGTIVEHNFTVPEMVSNYLDGLPSIDTTYANRATTSGAQVHLTPLRDGVATAVVHLRSDPITSVAALKSEVCATSASMTGGVASVITIASNGCTLVRNTQYDVYVYIQDGNDESDGTVSAPMELMLLSNEFSVDPTIRAPILPDTVSFVFTASRNGKMWAMIVDRASAASVKLSTMSAMRSLSSAKGGSLCSFGSAGVVANEVTTIVLFDCDGSSGLRVGSPYTLFVYVEDLSGALGTLKSLSFVVPEIVSNYFDGTPSVVAGTLTTSGVSLTMRSLFDGVAWLVVQRSSVGLESIVALKQSACKTSVSVSAGNSIILAVSSCALQLSASYNIYAYVEDSRGLNDGSLSAPMNVIVMSNNFMVSPTIRAPVNPESLTVQFSAQSSGFVWLMIVNRNDAYLAYNSSALKSEHPLGATLRRGGKMCRREKLAVVAGVAVRETLYDCNEGSNFLSVGAKYTLMAYIEDVSGAEGTIVEHNFTVPEMVSNYLDGLPSIDTTYANRATTSGAQVHLTPLRDGVATAVVHLRSDPITSVAALKSEVCATSASMTGGVASVITIASNGCTLVRNTQYDVYVYIEDGNDESDGTVSAPMELMLLSNEFSVDPTIRAPILPDTVSFVFTASRNGKMWAMIVDRASAASVKLSTMSAMRSLSSAKGGSLCSFGSAGVVANEVTTIVLFDCDGSSGLHIGSPYTLFVYVEDLSGALGTLKSLSFVVPEIVSNYFDGTPSVVAGTLTKSGVSLTMRSLFDGVAWLVVQRSSVGLESIVALKQSACKTSVSVSAGNSIILAVSSCALQLSASYNIYAYVEDSRGLNDGSLSAPMNVIVMSNNFMVSPTIRAPVNPESLTVQFSAQSSGFVWLMIVNRNDAYLAYNSSALKSEHPIGATLRRGGKMCRREKLAVVAGVAMRETLYDCNEGSNFLSVGAKYTLMAYIEDTSGVEGTIVEHNFTVPEMVSNYLDGLPSIDTTYANRATTSGAQVHLTPLRDGVATAVVHLRSDPITSVAALKSEVCATSASMTGGVASVITIASNGCTLVRNTQYDVYVYIQDGNDESDGTVSAPMELMLLSNEFSVDPTIQAPILPDTVSFVFTASRNGKMWAMIVDRASAASVKLSTMSAMRSLSSAKGGSLCSFGSAGVVANEVTTIVLFDCDGSSGLRVGSPYTLFVYVEDLSGALGTLKSLSFVVPEIVSNYFDGTPSVVAGTLTKSGVSLTMRSLFDGVAWLVVQRSSVGLESIVALKQSACKTSVSVSAGKLNHSLRCHRAHCS